MCLIASLGFNGSGVNAAAFFCILIFFTLFYHLYAKKRQTLSQQEHRVLLTAHVMKFNQGKNKPKARKNMAPRGPSNKNSSSHAHPSSHATHQSKAPTVLSSVS
jgi:hypothetical protein